MESRARMWIEELTIKGYGGLKDLGIEPSEGLNVILGAAQSGKSTVANCALDLLLGPGRWRGAEAGPRGGDAQPRTGDRFYARVRYRVEQGASRLLQRDFSRNVCRVQDEAGAVLDLVDDRAPGVVPPALFPASRGGADGEAPRLVEAREAAAAWRHRADRARLAEMQGRLRALETLAGQEQDLDARLRAQEGSAMPRKDLEALLESRKRLALLEGEIEDLSRRVDELRSARADAASRLAPLKAWSGVSPSQLALVRDFESLDMGRRLVEEKKKTLEGFIAQEADVARRLEAVSPHLADAGTEAEFDLALSRLERDLTRDDLLATRTAELKRLEQQALAHGSRARSGMVGAVVGCLLAVAMTVMLVKTQAFVYAVLLGVGGAVAGASIMFKTREERMGVEIKNSLDPVAADVEKLTQLISVAKAEISTVLAKAGVKTIHELRNLHRDFCRLQRDRETVKGYVAGLERELREARVSDPKDVEQGRALLKQCGLLPDSGEVTSQVIETFLERHAQHQSLADEFQGLEKRAGEASSALDARRKEVERLRALQDRLLGSGRAGGEAARAQAIEKMLDQGSRLEALLGELKQIRARMQEVSAREGGMEGLFRAAEEVRTRVERNEGEHEAWRRLEVDVGALDEYTRRAAEADEKTRDLQHEAEAAGSGPSPEIVKALDSAASGLAETFKSITGLPLTMRLSREEVEAGVVLIPPAGLRLEVSRTEGTWTAPSMLGRTATVLLEGLLPGEVQVQPHVGGNLPVFLDNPFVGLNEARRDKGLEWLLKLAARRQVFFLTTEVADRDRLRKVLAEKRWTVREKQEGALEFLSAAPASR